MSDQIVWKNIDDFCNSFVEYSINVKGHFLTNYAKELIKEFESRHGRPDAEMKFILLNDLSISLFWPIIVEKKRFLTYFFNSVTDDLFKHINKPWHNSLHVIEGKITDKQQEVLSNIYGMFLGEELIVRAQIVKYLVSLFGLEVHYSEPIKQFISSFIRSFSEANNPAFIIDIQSEKDTIKIYDNIKDDPMLYEIAAEYAKKYKK